MTSCVTIYKSNADLRTNKNGLSCPFGEGLALGSLEKPANKDYDARPDNRDQEGNDAKPVVVDAEKSSDKPANDAAHDAQQHIHKEPVAAVHQFAGDETGQCAKEYPENDVQDHVHFLPAKFFGTG
jgi:hypothetical protein